MPLDKVDTQILDILQKDSATPYVEIAEKADVTDGTIHQRVRKLKKTGIIELFTIRLNKKKIGWRSCAYVSITLDPGNLEYISKEIVKLPNVLEVYEVHTHNDLLVKIIASSNDEIREIVVKNIRKIKGVQNTDLIPIYKVWKEESILPIKEKRPS